MTNPNPDQAARMSVPEAEAALAPLEAAVRAGRQRREAADQTALRDRRERYAAALYATLEVSPTRHPWTTLSPLRRSVWYARADAAMELADEEHAAGQTPADTAAEMENARRSFPNGVRPALCKALAAADQRNIGRLPIPDRKRYTEQADAVMRLMGWRENQLNGQYLDTLKALRAAEASQGAVRAATLREAANRLDAHMERFFAEWPDEPRTSPYALGWKDAEAELRRLADEQHAPDAPEASGPQVLPLARALDSDLQVWPLDRVLSEVRCGSEDWPWE
ncbi:hypothetical protein, partial [Streptomyces sp. C1-2]|uniref:hypothetical protein n=1 Tax=Streptomyces sp. C1-2 TaxID=2720022 RepID=UPI0019D0D9E5